MPNYKLRHKEDNFNISLNAIDLDNALTKITGSGVTKKQDWECVSTGPIEIYNYVRHVVPEMDNGMQRCVICGKIIIDYRNTMTDKPGGVLTGWRAGDLYISKKGNPSVMLSDLPDEPWYEIENCK